MASSDSESQSPILWERLQGLFEREERAAGEPRRGLAIVLCIVLSCFLWFVFTLQDTYTAVLEFPTRIDNLAPDQALTALPPPSASVQVQGEGLQLLRLAFDPPLLPIDVDAGQINLETALPDLPADVRLESVSPRYLELRKEPRAARRVPVRLRARIQTPPTHALMEAPRIEPDSVTVSGARSIVDSLRFWPTDSVRVPALTDTLRLTVPLTDTLGQLVTRGTDQVQMQAEARQFTQGERRIEVRIPGTPERTVTLEPPTVRVRYRVLVSEYDAAQRSSGFYATVPYEVILSDTTGRVEPRVHAPENLSIRDLDVFPPTLRYYNFIPDE